MKKAINILAAISFLSNVAFAQCDFSKGITPGPNNTFVYTKECHEAVGAMKKANDDLTKAITLKDLAIQTSDQRTQNWMDNSFKMEDRLNKIDSLQKKNDWTFFVLGALTVIATGFVTASLTNRH